MNNFFKDNWFKLSILLLLILGVAVVSYYLLVYTPQENAIHQAVQSVSQQAQPSVVQPAPQVDPQVKIEKCKTSAEIQAQQELQAWWKQQSIVELNNTVATNNALCGGAGNDISCTNAVMDNSIKNIPSEKNTYYEQQYQKDYLNCLNQP